MEGDKEFGKVLNNTVVFKVLTRQAAGIRRHAGSTGQISGADNLYEQYVSISCSRSPEQQARLSYIRLPAAKFNIMSA